MVSVLSLAGFDHSQMASKQLGKFRQWAGEVISSKDRTTVTDEFRELERDIELRKDGVLQLHMASEAYHRALSKKKDSEALDEPDKLLPLDALGIVQIRHGEEYGEESAYGTSLVKMGRAHCKAATLQEAYALTFQDTYLTSLQRAGEDIKDLEHQKKKLESRRLSYDAAITKLEKLKNNKKAKEKDVKEAEEELQKARLRYEETSEDVRARMHAIQEKEISQLRELTEFLDVEMNYVQQYLEVLKDAKANWCDESTLKHVDVARSAGPPHVFARSGGSVRSRNSLHKSRSNSTNDEDDDNKPAAGRKTPTHRKSDSTSTTTKAPSRPSSRASRKRSDSNTTAGGEEKKEKPGRTMSVSGWASTLTGRGKKDKDKFAALKDDSEESDRDDAGEVQRPPSSRSFSYKKTPTKSKSANSSPSIPARAIKTSSSQSKEKTKLVRALYDFSGSSDELSFKVGDEIVVVNEVLDGWWMGELDGRKGLFPTPYTEPLSKPQLPARPGRLDPSPDHTRHGSQDTSASDLDADHPFADQHLDSIRSPLYGHYDEASSAAEEEEEEELNLMPVKPLEDDGLVSSSPVDLPPSIYRAVTGKRSVPDLGSGGGKKVPPPPPPRRGSNNMLSTPPMIPSRPNAVRSLSTSSISVPRPTSSIESSGDDTSPFDSTSDFSTATGGCRDFKQNPFKPKGMCSNCFQFHS
ncbi:hypothetical protein PLICRDRAFT_53282 [Plicaturopsis crispa FD-325 SS-3]|nr:hypothetical protein PLICRDRAFT_53282 [Plicaturopsis crispa FD-325 SS-3]